MKMAGNAEHDREAGPELPTDLSYAVVRQPSSLFRSSASAFAFVVHAAL